MGNATDVQRFALEFGLEIRTRIRRFRKLAYGGIAGFAEVIVPPLSPVVGKTLEGIAIRKAYGVEPIMTLIGDKEERSDYSIYNALRLVLSIYRRNAVR